MKKMAVFVEGLTEQLFVEKLLMEIITRSNLYVVKESASKNKKGDRVFSGIDATNKYSNQKYYIIIRDCGGETNVQSDIIDNCESLWASGCGKILGIRDIFPLTKADIPKLRAGMKYGVPTKYMPISIILAMMETESWFLGEHSHFSRIHPDLTQAVIKNAIGFDPWIDNPEDRHHPAEDLDTIYSLVNFRYTKVTRRIARTVTTLDYANIYLGMTSVTSLKELIDEVNGFLT